MLRIHQRTLFCFLLALVAACGAGGVDLTEAPDERAANEVLVALDRAGMTATKEKSTGRNAIWTVRVEEDQVARAHGVLKRLGLPRSEHAGFSEMLADSGVIPSKSNEHARLMYATSEELARTLEQHQRVLSARVHVVQPQERLGDKIRVDPRGGRPTASVMIRYIDSGAADAAMSGSGDDLQKAAKGGSPAADLFQQTLRDVFEEIAVSSHAKIVVAIRTELRAISQDLGDELGDELAGVLARQMNGIGRQAKTRIEAVFGGEDSEKISARSQRLMGSLEEMLSDHALTMTGVLRGELADLIGGYRFGAEALTNATPAQPSEIAEAGSPGDLVGRLEGAVLNAIANTKTEDLVDGLLQPDDSAEVRFVKSMMRDFYKLPPAVRELAEKRIAPENPDWPFSRTEVRMLVAHAVEGMWPWDVNVVYSSIDGNAMNASFRRGGDGTSTSADEASTSRSDGSVDAAAGSAAELESKQRKADRMSYLAGALGASTLVLFVLLARERRRNGALSAQLTPPAPAGA
ncbi:MAG: type III secretion system YscJ/HrcJ family lipoprotein [Planctomycetota bacterium]|jgi:type III secretion system YscJ/HrcJ family lipoprotein